jgi:hypothetical protein
MMLSLLSSPTKIFSGNFITMNTLDGCFNDVMMKPLPAECTNFEFSHSLIVHGRICNINHLNRLFEHFGQESLKIQ